MVAIFASLVTGPKKIPLLHIDVQLYKCTFMGKKILVGTVGDENKFKSGPVATV